MNPIVVSLYCYEYMIYCIMGGGFIVLFLLCGCLKNMMTFICGVNRHL
jgi:hypothetical protein